MIKRFRKLVKIVRRLKSNNFQTCFPHEGNLSIKLPIIRYADLLGNNGQTLARQCSDYHARGTSESLLRKSVYDLFCSGYLDSRKSVIDIGCWLSDNSVIWAKLLREQGVVYAIDPSTRNLEFGKKVAALNNVNNIQWLQAVCSDKPNIPLDYTGEVEHAQFLVATNGTANNFLSTTLDEIIPKASHDSISLLHIDVEGFEEKVMLGAENIISKSKPVIIFEQHISAEDSSHIISFLKKHQYDIYMINEVLPGCDLDCRNFIAFNTDNAAPPAICVPEHTKGRSKDIWYATLGPSFIKV